jgi:hypothetical protein
LPQNKKSPSRDGTRRASANMFASYKGNQLYRRFAVWTENNPPRPASFLVIDPQHLLRTRGRFGSLLGHLNLTVKRWLFLDLPGV